MKKLFLVFVSLFALNAMATGGFDCKNEKENIELYATTAMMSGNPVVGDIVVVYKGEERVYARNQTMGYWNMGKVLKLALADKEFMGIEVQLEAKRNPFSDFNFQGKLTLPEGTFKVKCIVE